MTDLITPLDYALCYHDLGINVIPVNYKAKQPLVDWKQFQTQKVTEQQIRNWFKNNHINIGAICGSVSNNLTIMDFDKMEAYNQWKNDYPTLAKTLPTVTTGKGKHIYTRSDDIGIKRLAGIGDFISSKGYCVAPPSTHGSGINYKWEIPLTNENLIFLDPMEAGFISSNVTNSNRQLQTVIDSNRQVIETVLKKTRAREEGTRHRQTFCFALELKKIFPDAHPAKLEHIFKEWYNQSKVRTDYDESYFDFITTYQDIDVFQSIDKDEIIARARGKPPPEIVKRLYPDKVDLQLFANICRELQIIAGEAPFFFSTGDGAKYLNVSKMTISRFYKILEIEGLIETVKKYDYRDNREQKANRYKYLGEI